MKRPKEITEAYLKELDKHIEELKSARRPRRLK